VPFKKKLVVVFCAMTVPLAVIGAQALWGVREQLTTLRRLQLGLSRARVFAEVESLTYRKVRKIRDYLSGQDATARAQFEWLDAQSKSKLAVWKAAIDEPSDLQHARRFEELDGELGRLARHLFSLFEDGRREEALQLAQRELNDRLLPSLDATITGIYASSRTRNVERAFSEAEASARSTTRVLIAIVALSALLSGIFSFVIARNLARPIEQLRSVMERVGEGDFERAQALDVSGKDEIGDLARAFVQMAERLRLAQEALRQKIDTLRETQSQLVQSEKLASLGQMAAAVAHGLRNPLASIRAATQLSLHRLPAESPLRESLSAVIGEVDRLEKRIVHLLDFTKPVAFAPSATSLRELLEGVVGVFDEKLAKQGVRLQVELAPALPDAWVDASQVEQAVIEVVANALDAMPGGGSLAVAARSRTPAGDKGVVELTIEDTGDGIAACDLPRVGEPFFTTKAEGTGLGVAIARRFVEQNQGEFVIASVGEKGTLVTISLPALRAPGGAGG
jgi:signal transduction histidine kinase